MDKKATYVVVDLENNGVPFWDNLRNTHADLADRFDENHAELVTEEEIKILQGTPGFYDENGPHAPHPVQFLSYEDAMDSGWLEEE